MGYGEVGGSTRYNGREEKRRKITEMGEKGETNVSIYVTT
jgi:hypothetical protein